MPSQKIALRLLQFSLILLLILGSVTILWNKNKTFSVDSVLVSLNSTSSNKLSPLCNVGSSNNLPLDGAKEKDPELTCSVGYVKRGTSCVECPKGKFSLSGWISCESMLDCDKVRRDVTKGKVLLGLVNWIYYLSEWNGYEIVYSQFNAVARTEVNYALLQQFSPSHYFLYPIGFCEEDRTFLFALNETFKGVLTAINKILTQSPVCNTCEVRLNLIISYLQILSRLHANRVVLCNSRTLDNLLAQFLVSSDYSLVLVTLDNLQSDTQGGVLCFRSELAGSFVAPEQRWPYGMTKIFNRKEQPTSDIRSDIWKVPDVVAYILAGSCADVMDYLYVLNFKCKSVNPQDRPTVHHLLAEYQSIQRLLFS